MCQKQAINFYTTPSLYSTSCHAVHLNQYTNVTMRIETKKPHNPPPNHRPCVIIIPQPQFRRTVQYPLSVWSVELIPVKIAGEQFVAFTICIHTEPHNRAAQVALLWPQTVVRELSTDEMRWLWPQSRL